MASNCEDAVNEKCRKPKKTWIILNGKVYNVEPYLAVHPGGDAILRNAGGDATEGFKSVKAHKCAMGFIESKLEEFYVADVDSFDESMIKNDDDR